MARLTAALAALYLTLQPPLVPQQVVRATTDLVPVYLTVTGRDGRSIKGLTAADFTLTDGGKPRKIALCRELVDELHHEYLLGFTPALFDGKSHKIQVKTRVPGARIRSRTTYLAGKR